MFIIKRKDKNKINLLNKSIDKLSKMLEEMNFREIIYVLGNKKEIIKRNLLAGISRGLGFSIGFYLITAILIYILQYIVKLNIPIIGKYISDIVEIVQAKNQNWY